MIRYKLCLRCRGPFTVTPANTCARKCLPCREEILRNRANRTRATRPRPDGHTDAWDQSSLGIVEAAVLRMAWHPQPGLFVTSDSL